MNNILVTGANGQLGQSIKELNEKCFFTDRDKLDITDFKEIENFCKQNKITHIINCAAYTAVDKAEDEKEFADKINYDAVKNLAQISKDHDISLVHISTDYVFDGKNYKPYCEDDKTNPVNYYGESKLKGEEAVKKINPKNSVIIRTSWVYSSIGSNFVKTMLRLMKDKDELGVIFDQIGTPTYARDLAKTILEILPKLKDKDTQIYNYSNEGVCSWYDFAKEIADIKGYDCRINPIHTSEYPTPAKRPHFSILDKQKIKDDFDITVPYWKDSLKECLKEMI